MNNSKIAKEADSLAKSLAELPTEERKKLEDIITALKLVHGVAHHKKKRELDALTKKEKRLLGLQTVVGGTAKTSKESNSLEKADRTKNKN